MSKIALYVVYSSLFTQEILLWSRKHISLGVRKLEF